MNAALQWLAHTNDLATYFLEGKFYYEINKENENGTGGKVSEEFYYIIKQLSDKDKSVNIELFKHNISKFIKSAWGFHQEDSSEFLTEFIDKLHEDLNNVKQSF